MAEENVTGAFHDTLIISEFQGSFPEIPLFKDVDFQELTDGEAKPVFVTLPIGKANVLSGNRRFYDEAFLLELERQVADRKPIGLMGHLSSDQKGWAMPPEAVHWVGAMRVKEYLLGKGFLPMGESRSRLQRYRATGSKIATSIDATGEGVWDDALGAHKMIASTLRLNQIDIAPADRAGIADLAAVPLLTREMAEQGGIIVVRTQGAKKMTEEEKAQALREMKATDAASLPAEVKAALIQEFTADIRKSLGLGDGDIVTEVKKIQERDTQREKDAVTARIVEISSTGDKAVKVESIREMVVELVESKAPKTVAEVDTIYAEVLNRPSVKKALQLELQETMGPSQTTPTQSQSSTQSGGVPGMKGTWFVLPATK
jgi:hypothetical protein